MGIIFAGSGHGGIAAYKSLIRYFDTIDLITQDQEIIALMRDEDHLIEEFNQSKFKYAILAGYLKIIGSEILKEKIIINTHPSLLPKYRGRHAVVWAMLNEEKELGFTVHLINEYIDAGDIIYQFKIKYNNQTSKEIMDIFDKFVERNLGQIVDDFIKGKIMPKEQDHRHATWVPKRNLSDCFVDFNMPINRLKMFFKALVSPYPLPRILVNNRVYEIIEYSLIERYYYTQIGCVVNIEDENVYVKTNGGILILKKLFCLENKEIIFPHKILKIGQRLM